MKKLILFFSFLAFTAVAQAQVTSLAENFNTCDTTDVNGAHPSGWTTYNAVGSQKWFWTYTFGVTYGTGGIQVNGYQGGNNANEDWLITPKLDLSSYSTIYLHFYARFKFAGAPLQVLYSTDYTGTGNPNSATWTAVTMNRPFAAGDTVWNMFSANMTSVKSTPLFVAFKYTSTTSDGSRWTIDSVFTSSTSGINNVSIENTPVSI
ncbi:MAG: hypothetical protein EBZ77_13550, partial [Chitinophagia bacterium]|nr:hypothetical protein [Chitinophagia bacterium]